MSIPTSHKSMPAVGSRWLRTRPEVRGKGLHVVVTSLEPALVGDRSYYVVRYRHEANDRMGNMPAKKFVHPGHHVLVGVAAATSPPAASQTDHAAPSVPSPTLKTLHDALLTRAMSLLPPQTIAPVGSEIVGGHDDTALRIYEMLTRNPLPAEATDRDRFTAARLALFACGFNCISVKRDGDRYRLVATEEESVASPPDASAPPAVVDSDARLFRSFAAANGFQATMGQDPATAPLWTVAVWISEARLYPAFTEWCSAHSVITEDVAG